MVDASCKTAASSHHRVSFCRRQPVATGLMPSVLKPCFLNACSNAAETVVLPTPVSVPAMKNAGAIITDEGGITSHAAIVSRELGIPCVIGTKIATKVLKDGDLVEVKANHGIVKIIRHCP